MNNGDSPGVGFGFTSFADGPPSMPPIGEARLPRRSPNSRVISHDKNIELVDTSRYGGHRGARRCPTSIQFPPAVPPVGKRWLPRCGPDHSVHVCDEDIK